MPDKNGHIDLDMLKKTILGNIEANDADQDARFQWESERNQHAQAVVMDSPIPKPPPLNPDGSEEQDHAEENRGTFDPTSNLYESYYVPTVAEINRAARETDPNPTEGQRKSGGYRKGRIRIHGLLVTIENAKGSFRRGVSENGKPWETKMLFPYGYITQISGETAGRGAADGEHHDCYLGPTPESEIVFVIDQQTFDGEHDESKCMIGWTNAKDAKEAYLAHYSKDWKGFAGIKAMTLPEFKHWLAKGKGKPVVEGREPTTLLEDKSLFGPGFTGTMTDSLGRLMTFVDGKHVKGQHNDEPNRKPEVVHATVHNKPVHVVSYDPDKGLVKVQFADGKEEVVDKNLINNTAAMTAPKASKEANEEAERYMDAVMPTLDKMVDDAVANGETVPTSFGDLDPEKQQEIEHDWILSNVGSYYDRELESWRDSLDESVKDSLREDHDWHNEAFVNWAVENAFTKESAEAALEPTYTSVTYGQVNWPDMDDERGAAWKAIGVPPEKWPTKEREGEIRQGVLGFVNAWAAVGQPDKYAGRLGVDEACKSLGIPVFDVVDHYAPNTEKAIVDRSLDAIFSAQRRTRIDSGHTYKGFNPDFSRLRTEDGKSIEENDLDEDDLVKKWENDYEKLQDKEVESRYESESENPPHDLQEKAHEQASEAFDQLSDEEKMQNADVEADIDVEEPDEWKVFQDGDDYKKTRSVALYLQTTRAADLIRERIFGEAKNGFTDVDNLSHRVWAAWKTSSTSALGLALQQATAEELNGHLRIDDVGKKTAEDGFRKVGIDAAAGGIDKKVLADMDRFAIKTLQARGELPIPENVATMRSMLLGKEIMKAYARATWEASQYVLRKAYIKEITTWRALMLSKDEVDKESHPQAVQLRRRRDVGEPASAGEPETFTKLPDLHLLRNGCASATRSASVANNWNGVGVQPHNAERVVLRITSPRTAVLSAPCFGQNLESEQETVLAGTTWTKWDAWLGRAPQEGFEEMSEDQSGKQKADVAHVNESAEPEKNGIEIDLFQIDLEAGKNWLSDVRNQGRKKRQRQAMLKKMREKKSGGEVSQSVREPPKAKPSVKLHGEEVQVISHDSKHGLVRVKTPTGDKVVRADQLTHPRSRPGS